MDMTFGGTIAGIIGARGRCLWGGEARGPILIEK